MGTKLLVMGAVVALCACKYDKETIPVRRAEADVRVPNQQRVVALATDQAVEALDFAKLQGKSVDLALSGVFPHSDEDLLGYLRAQVEAKLARAGARVIVQPPILVVPGAQPAVGAPNAANASLGALGTLALGEPADYHLLVNVSWGGIDIRDKVTTDEPLLTKQIGLAVGGLIAGALLIEISDSSFRQTFAELGMAAVVVGDGIWFKRHSPFPHVITLIGRVKIVAQAIPTKDGTAFTSEGNGESKIVTDERLPEGYMVVE